MLSKLVDIYKKLTIDYNADILEDMKDEEVKNSLKKCL